MFEDINSTNFMMATLFLLLLFLTAFNSWGRPSIQWDEQVLEVADVNGAILGEPVVAFSQEADVFLPILDMGKILGVPIEQPGPAKFKIFQNETDHRLIDFGVCPVDESFCENFFLKNNTYYLRTSYLKDDLGWPISIDLRTLQVVINIGLNARENKIRKKDKELPFIITRKKFGYPSARIEGTVASVSDYNILNLYETQPLLQHDSDILLSTSSRDTRFLWTLSKEVVEANDVYEIKNYELLSTQTLDTKFLFGPAQITGVRFSNIRNGENIFDTQNLHEQGPPRWKVELYINEIYLGETFVDLEGNFSFLNVPIFYGQNNIYYKLISPIGQTIDVRKSLDVSSEFQGQGRLKYQGAFGQVQDSNKYQGGAVFAYGISSYISAQAGMAHFQMNDSKAEQKNFSLLGLSYLQPSYSFSATKMTSFKNEETAYIFTPRFNLGPLLVSTEYAKFEDFHSLLINTRESENIVGSRRVAVLSPLPTTTPISAQLGFQEWQHLTANSTQEIQARLYAMLPASSVLLESNKFWPANTPPDLYVEYGNYRHFLRVRFGVQMQNNKYSKSKFGAEYLYSGRLFFTAATEVAPNIDDSSVTVGANSFFADLQAEFNISRSSQQVLCSLTLSTNLFSDEKGVRFSSAENYRQSSIVFFAFVDENSNGKFDADEKSYGRLKIRDNQRQKEYETNEAGLVKISGLNPYQRFSFQILKESISNIFLTAQDFQNDYILTPAQELKIEIPIRPTFDVRGQVESVYFKKFVPLEMTDLEGKVLATTNTTSSGKYTFSDLPAGTYFIQIEPAFLSANKLKVEQSNVAVELIGRAGPRYVEAIKIQPLPPKK